MKAASLPVPADAKSSGGDWPRLGVRRAWPVAMLGVPIENLSISATVERVAAMVATRQPHLVTITTAARLLRAQSDRVALRHLADAELVLSDSAALKLASWWFGNPLRTRVRPAELTRRLAQLSVLRGWRVFLLGSSAQEIAAAEARLRRRHPKLQIAGTFAPLVELNPESTEADEAIAAAGPDLLLVWSDSPALDTWLAARHAAWNVPVCLHFPGCSAPRRGESQVRRASPTATGRSWRERLRNAWALIPRLWQQRRCLSAGRRGGDGLHLIRSDAAWIDVVAGQSLTRSSLDQEPGSWSYDVMPASHCAVDVSRVKHIDATGVAFLARHRAACRRANRRLVLIAPSTAVHRALADSQILEFFETAATAAEARQRAPRPPAGAVAGVMRSLAWCGEIIAANVDDVWQMTSDYLSNFTRAGATLVVIDLARLRLVDNAGAALMVRVKQCARRLRTEVLFAHPQPQVQQRLQLASLDFLLLEGAQ